VLDDWYVADVDVMPLLAGTFADVNAIGEVGVHVTAVDELNGPYRTNVTVPGVAPATAAGGALLAGFCPLTVAVSKTAVPCWTLEPD
jgi:hypothetical protein